MERINGMAIDFGHNILFYGWICQRKLEFSVDNGLSRSGQVGIEHKNSCLSRKRNNIISVFCGSEPLPHPLSEITPFQGLEIRVYILYRPHTKCGATCPFSGLPSC